MVRCVRGQITFALDIAPRFDYGREPHEAHLGERGALFRSVRESATVHIIQSPETASRSAEVDRNGGVHGEVALHAGQVRPDSRDRLG
jgi:hypothetical protein